MTGLAAAIVGDATLAAALADQCFRIGEDQKLPFWITWAYCDRAVALRLEGKFEEAGLLPGPHVVVARTEDGRIGYDTNVPVTAGKTTVTEIQVRQGATLLLRNRSPQGWIRARATQDGIPIGYSEVHAGTITTLILPPGKTVIGLAETGVLGWNESHLTLDTSETREWSVWSDAQRISVRRE